jgi:hypothetical protein
MSITLRRYRDTDFEAIGRFNRRMEAGGSPHRLYHEDLWKNPTADLDVRPINDSLWVAADDDELRGGAWLREQYFWVDGARHRVGWMKYAIAESLVDPKYATVPFIMVRGLVKQQPQLMALGMGGHDAPFARLLDAAKWRSSTVPFYFHVLRPFAVLRGLRHLRRRPIVARAMDVAAWTGAGWLAGVLHRLPAVLARAHVGVDTIVADGFASWANVVWERCRGEYDALAVRDARALDFRFPASGPDAVDVDRMRVRRSGEDIGWVCVQITEDLVEHFGALRVGVILDALARPSDAEAVLAAAVRRLRKHSADIVVANLAHDAWGRAARRLRFLSGPSNMAFYRSPGADELLSPVNPSVLTACHITRGDD